MTEGVPTVVSDQLIAGSQMLAKAFVRMKDEFATWDDERLIEFYRTAGQLETGAFAVQCAVCHTLAQRYSQGNSGRSGIREAARLLMISENYARELSSIWINIFSRLKPGEDPENLPPRFYERALRARRYNVDPVEAIRYAAHVRSVLGRSYTTRDFEDDIRMGLPDPESKPPGGFPLPICSECSWFSGGSFSALLYLVEGEKTVAKGSGEDVQYCAKYAELRSSLGNLSERASRCPDFQPRKKGDGDDQR